MTARELLGAVLLAWPCPGWVLSSAAGPRPLALRHVTLDLPAAPAAVVPADLDGDGRRDLLVVVAYTDWESIGADRIEGLVQVTEVVPALFDRRELRAYLAMEDGTYRLAGTPLPLPVSVLCVEAGAGRTPAVALTDDGVDSIRIERTGEAPRLVLEPFITDPPVLAGSGSLDPDLDLVQDVDRDGQVDLVLAAEDGLAIYAGNALGFDREPTSRIPLPGDRRMSGGSAWRSYPLPILGDLDHDGIADLTVIDASVDVPRLYMLRGAGKGRFLAPREIAARCLGLGEIGTGDAAAEEHREGARRALIYFGDLDSDGRTEAVTSLDASKPELKAKSERTLLRFHRLRADLTFDPKPYQELEVPGFPFGRFARGRFGGDFEDLDRDGRLDLVTATFDVPYFQMLRAFVTKRVSVGIGFHVFNQGADGRFRQVEGRRFDEKLVLDLKNLKIDRFPQFAGDFDGDGRIDFVQLGQGRKVAIHRGQEGCVYPAKADLLIELDEEIENLALVRVIDLDGDSRADLVITRPLPASEPEISMPARLDLYLSGNAR